MFIDPNKNQLINNEDSSSFMNLNIQEGQTTSIKFFHFGTTIINSGIFFLSTLLTCRRAYKEEAGFKSKQPSIKAFSISQYKSRYL